MGRSPTHYTLRTDDVAEVRIRLLTYLNAERLTFGQVAHRCGLEAWQIRDFLGDRSCVSLDVVGAICSNLPLSLAYEPPRITFA